MRILTQQHNTSQSDSENKMTEKIYIDQKKYWPWAKGPQGLTKSDATGIPRVSFDRIQ